MAVHRTEFSPILHIHFIYCWLQNLAFTQKYKIIWISSHKNFFSSWKIQLKSITVHAECKIQLNIITQECKISSYWLQNFLKIIKSPNQILLEQLIIVSVVLARSIHFNTMLNKCKSLFYCRRNYPENQGNPTL